MEPHQTLLNMSNFSSQLLKKIGISFFWLLLSGDTAAIIAFKKSSWLALEVLLEDGQVDLFYQGK